jgi:superfamily II DNA/RNA helicase
VTAIYGGVGYGPQKSGLRKGVDVLVATPGRLEDLIEQGAVDLSQVAVAVIDEADRMADMGFLPAVRRILDRTAQDRQTLLFSATLDGDIAVLSRRYQRDPVRHEAGSVEPKTVDASHHFWLVQHHDRARHTADLVATSGQSIVFTRTRHGADRLAKQLGKLGVEAVSLHGGRTQSQRTRALRSFASGRAVALVATDVAARGIHIDDVASVVHFDPPADHKDYLHRSGRTARAGSSGMVVSLVTKDQQRAVRKLQRDLDLRIPIGSRELGALAGPGSRVIDGETADADDRGGERPAAPRRRNRESHTELLSVYVANLPWASTSADLTNLFGRHGQVHQSTVITNRKTGRSKGFGFVDMPKADAHAAVAALHGSPFEGRPLTVRVARP